MRTYIYVITAVAVTGFSSAGAQNTGNPASRPLNLPPVAEPAPPARLAPMPPIQPNSSMGQDMPNPPNPESLPKATEPMQPNAAEQELMPNSTTQPMQPAQPTPTNPNSTVQQTVFPPDSRIDPNNPANSPLQQQQQQSMAPNNNVNTQPHVPPASQGVGKPGRPDCSKMQGLEKSECERRDTSRDDLPAGVTTTQPPQ
ncbi:hypothetical protein [Steroidobacter cummioxidans]|uniref:hypothetical protein n=1 Tax=Steroidobacter cummioxidans TaxID=1803913 RepID=UPI001290626D|nr:hypothetical protein [Steroidobacter cummioxidans]